MEDYFKTKDLILTEEQITEISVKNTELSPTVQRILEQSKDARVRALADKNLSKRDNALRQLAREIFTIQQVQCSSQR